MANTRSKIKTNIDKVNNKRSWLRFTYGDYVRQWEGIFNDDRQLFCNMYNQILDAIDDLEFCKNPIMFCAFNDYVKKDYEVMNRIIERFKK